MLAGFLSLMILVVNVYSCIMVVRIPAWPTVIWPDLFANTIVMLAMCIAFGLVSIGLIRSNSGIWKRGLWILLGSVQAYAALSFRFPYVALSLQVFFAGVSLLWRRGGIRVRRDDVVISDGLVRPASTLDQRPESSAKNRPSSGAPAYCSVCRKDVEIDDDYRCVHCGWQP